MALSAAVIGALASVTAGSAALASSGRGTVYDRAAAVHLRTFSHGPGTDSAGGTRLWLARYAGTGSGESANAVAVSPDGSMVFVAGTATVAYDATTGARLWVAPTATYRFGASNVAVSPDGSTVFVTGGSSDTSGTLQYLTIAYDAATGTQLWDAAYHGPGAGDDRPHSMAVSPDGSKVFVAGQSSNSTTTTEDAYATVAYDAATGAQLWVTRYSDGNLNADANAVTVSPDGAQVYVTGGSLGPAGNYSYATAAYSAATGATAWAERYSQGSRNAGATAIAVSPDGSRLYVTGSTHGRRGRQNLTTVAYTASAGAMLWLAHYNGPAGGNSATSMAISKDGSELAVTGQGKTLSGRFTYLTVAYRAASGAQLWARYYGGPSDDKFGLAESVAVSPDGSKVFVTGYVNGIPPGGSTDYGTVAYDAATGASLWVRLYSGPVPGLDQGLSVAVSPNGSKVFVTGISQGRDGRFAIATLAYQS